MFLIQLHLHQFCFKIIQVCNMFFKSVRANFQKNNKFFQKWAKLCIFNRKVLKMHNFAHFWKNL
jgi:hypothetical protein